VTSEGRGAVLVTGAASGIGRAATHLLAAQGFHVLAGVRREGDARALVETATPTAAGRDGTPGIEGLLLDVTDPDAIAGAARRVEDATSGRGLAGLVNNAGIGVAGPLELLPLAELRRQLEVNLVAPVALCQALLPALRRGRGRIVHVGSSSGYLSTPLLAAYCASKFALEAVADAQRLELRPFGLEVSLVQPGAIATPIFDKSGAEADALLERLPEERVRPYAPAIAAVRRLAAQQVARARPPETVARAVLHALTARRPRTRYVVGADAWVELALVRLLPDRWRDAVLARMLGLPRAGSAA